MTKTAELERRLELHEGRFDRMESRFDRIESKLDCLQESVRHIENTEEKRQTELLAKIADLQSKGVVAQIAGNRLGRIGLWITLSLAFSGAVLWVLGAIFPGIRQLINIP